MFPHLPAIGLLSLTILCSLMLGTLPAQQGESASRHEPAIASMLPEGDITADVFQRLTTGLPVQDEETINSGKVDISIASDGKVFRFWTDGKLSLLESMTIDAEDNRVVLGDYPLEYAGKAISQDDDGLPNNWRGYRWSAEIPLHAGGFQTDKEIATKRYTVTLGLKRITGQTFLRIQKEYAGNDKTGTCVDLPLLF